jgi:predicted ATPase with chaperone activity
LLEECKIDQALLNETLVVGELALDGAVRAVQAVLPTVIFAKEK